MNTYRVTLTNYRTDERFQLDVTAENADIAWETAVNESGWANTEDTVGGSYHCLDVREITEYRNGYAAGTADARAGVRVTGWKLAGYPADYEAGYEDAQAYAQQASNAGGF